MSLADRLRELLGAKDDPAEDEPAAEHAAEHDDENEEEDDDPSVYPLW